MSTAASGNASIDRWARSGWAFCMCSAIVGVTVCVAGCIKQQPRSGAAGSFTAGRQALMRGEFEQAIKYLEAYRRQGKAGALASRATFLMAKSYLGLNDFAAAREWFERTISEYGHSEEAHKARYKLAMISLMQGEMHDARRRFQELVDRPSGTLVPEATAMLQYLDRQAATDAVPKGDASVDIR